MNFPLGKVLACTLGILLCACESDQGAGQAAPELPVTHSDAVLSTTQTKSEEARQQQAYLQQLRDPSPQQRAAAAKKIKAHGEALEVLTDLIRNDPSPEVRIATTWSLEKSKAPAALEALIGCLNDADNAVVIECMVSLKFAGDETTIEYLTPFLEDPDPEVRAQAKDAISFLE